MKNLMSALGVAGLLSLPVLGNGAEDVTITAAGSYDFQPATNPHGSLVNQVSDGKVTLTQTDNPQDRNHAVTFTNFDAVASAETEFSGGWWDFGAPTADTVNFFKSDSEASSRTTTLTGAVVTNVGTACVAGSSGTDNTLALKSGSSFTASSLILGSMAHQQRSKVTVEGASALNCLGDLFLTQSQVSTEKSALECRTGNELTVSGTDSSLTVGGTTRVGDKYDGNGLFGTAGGNTLTVTDGAKADLKDVIVAGRTHSGQCNKIVFGKDSRVNMANWYISTARHYTYSPASNAVEIVDGAVVTCSGEFHFGNESNAARGGNTFLISNAVFSADCVYKSGTVYYFLCGPNSTFTLSGPDAKFSTTQGFGAFFCGSGCTFVVENGANYTYPNGAYSYTVAEEDETIIARTGATLTFQSGLNLGNVGNKGTRNRLLVESDATVTSKSLTQITGDSCEIVVDDATYTTVNALNVGVSKVDSKAKLTLRGSHPYVKAAWNLNVYSNSVVRFELPETGYKTGYATHEKPVVGCGYESGNQGAMFDSSACVEIAGAKALQEHINKVGGRHEYVLMTAANGGINIPEANLAALQAALPAGSTLFKRYYTNNRWELVLQVKPHCGVCIILY